MAAESAERRDRPVVALIAPSPLLYAFGIVVEELLKPLFIALVEFRFEFTQTE
jgi:hypothetical protein